MSADPKQAAAIIVAKMRPPGAGPAGDEGESDSEASAEEDSGKMGGIAHLEEFKKQLDAGDMSAAWDAFMDAVQACKASDYSK